MLAAERQKKIEALIIEQKAVRVDNLAREFGVSEMTIRRDLDKFKRDGLLERCHGGAVINSEYVNESVYNEKSEMNVDAKRKIAEYAASFVKEGMTVYLDSGTSVLQIVQFISKIKNLTIVTNDLSIALAVATHMEAKIIMIGGSVQNELLCVHGVLAEQMLSCVKVDTAFVGGLAIDENMDLFSREEKKVSFRRLLMRQTRNTYLLVDESKFMKISLFKVHSIYEYTAVLTTKQLDDKERKLAEERGINIISV